MSPTDRTKLKRSFDELVELLPNQERTDVVRLEAGDLEIVVRLRPRLALGDDTHRKAVLALLKVEPSRATRCTCSTKKKSPYSSRRLPCSRRPVGAVVVRSTMTPGGVFYTFVCASHRDQHGYDAALGFVEVPRFTIDQARAECERRWAVERQREAEAESFGAHVVAWRDACAA